MSARREFALMLAAAVLLAALGLVLGGWTVPQLLEFAASPAVLIIAVWLVVLALALVVFAWAPAHGDEMYQRALEERRRERDWQWPDRDDVEVGRSR